MLARFSPFEWDNPYPCIEEPEELENQFNLPNAFWYVIGAIMQQGADVAPIALSTRWVQMIEGGHSYMTSDLQIDIWWLCDESKMSKVKK